jgi:hypothetical protein
LEGGDIMNGKGSSGFFRDGKHFPLLLSMLAQKAPLKMESAPYSKFPPNHKAAL